MNYSGITGYVQPQTTTVPESQLPKMAVPPCCCPYCGHCSKSPMVSWQPVWRIPPPG